jgi:hypothetical protein
LALVGAAMVVMGCDQASRAPMAQADDPQEGLLRGTEGMRDFGDYVVYVNTIMTSDLTPGVASQYGIVRSDTRAMLTISVHKKEAGAGSRAVTGNVNATAVNLTGQLRNVLLREIPEEDAIYYIGEVEVSDGETLIYTVDVTPAEESSPLSLRYQRQYFVDG